MNAQVSFAIKDQDAGTLALDSTIDGRVINVTRASRVRRVTRRFKAWAPLRGSVGT